MAMKRQSLKDFLDGRRTGDSEANITGMGHYDKGKYIVSDEEYDTFLRYLHDHIFGKHQKPLASGLLEKHRAVGPILLDLDLRYALGGPLVRKFNTDHIRNVICEYVAAMVFFSKVEQLEKDLCFYHLEKPAPENDKIYHKDGVHIQCPTITTTPRYQYGIRGFLLSQNVIDRVIGGTIPEKHGPEDVFDVCVIHKNNWFFYGACKPDKAQYKVAKIWKFSIADIRECLDGGDPADFMDLVESMKSIVTEDVIPTDNFELMKTLSIRRSHVEATPLAFRESRVSEWEELMISWGGGKARLEKPLPPTKNTIVFNGGNDPDDTSLVVGGEAGLIPAQVSEKDIELAYRLARECINPERRAGEYQDWINLAICLKNIANTEESFKVWVELTRSVDSQHKKSKMTDAELRAKWNLIRVDTTKKLSMPSLVHWSKEDNFDKCKSIHSEFLTDYIINYAKDTHVSVAGVVKEVFKNEFRCSMGAKRGAYMWFQYPTAAHSWKQLRTPTELRAHLSGRVRSEFVEAGKRLSTMWGASTDDTDKERIDGKRKLIFKVEHELEMTAFKDNVLKECQEKFYDDEFLNRLNANPNLLGVANGVLDLRHYDNDAMTGRPHVIFRAGRPDDNISFQMGRCDPDLDPIPYLPYDASQQEQKDLAEFFRKIYPDEILREYVLTLLASCLEGKNAEQKFYVMQGPGSNGKSMIEILMESAFGDYGTSMSTTVMTRKRPDSGAANPDIITVKCKRYIHTGEPDDNEKINTSIMKQYSGGDRLQARGLFSEQEKFVITGKIFMSCNDLPPVSKMDGGTWRRIRVIPHVSIFKDAGDPAIDPSKNIYEKDLDMENKLKHWRVAFLSLLVHYYETKYLVHGLKEPDCVGSASNKYKEDNDIFMNFFNDNFVKEAGAGPVLVNTVKTAFNDWKKTYGRSCDLKLIQVYERMKAHCASGSTEKEFYGVRLAEESDLSGALLQNMP